MANNIIFYFTDQQRWDTCGCYGQPLNITPNLDRMAGELYLKTLFLPSLCAALAEPCSRPADTPRKPAASAIM